MNWFSFVKRGPEAASEASRRWINPSKITKRHICTEQQIKNHTETQRGLNENKNDVRNNADWPTRSKDGRINLTYFFLSSFQHACKRQMHEVAASRAPSDDASDAVSRSHEQTLKPPTINKKKIMNSKPTNETQSRRAR